MLTSNNINQLLGITDSYQAPRRMLELMLDDSKRDETFKKFLDYEYHMDYEWFQSYYEQEHAQRKTNKQDFTPQSVSTLLARLANGDNYHEIACGNGGILIKYWNEQRMRIGIGKYDPRMFWYHTEELSDRAIPFLIFNMAIRGINGVVMHGNSLERIFKDVYFIRNMADQYGKFSKVIKMPHSKQLMNELNIMKWGEEFGK